jgi:hypothetical protein
MGSAAWAWPAISNAVIEAMAMRDMVSPFVFLLDL